MLIRLTNSAAPGAEAAVPFTPDTPCYEAQAENQLLNLYPEVTFQRWEGFGGALTDAAGSVFAQMKEEQKERFVTACFSPEGLGYNRVRIPLDSCDFSCELFEAMSDPNDREMKSFSFARTEKYILPLLEAAQKAAGQPLKLFLSPWSPPAFMKTNGQRVGGGKLKPEYGDFWAEYLCRYILEFRKRGYEVERISIQNEAKAIQTWDSCTYTAEEEKAFLAKHLHPALVRHGLESIEVFIWDHNKERLYERVRDTVDGETAPMIAGAAYHWYSGDHFEALDLVRTLYPQLKLITSESCIEYRFYSPSDFLGNALKLAHEVIGDLNHGASAAYDWNVLLNEEGGPNHVGNYCWASFLYDRTSGELTAQTLYDVYYQFSHYLRPGAVRVALTRYSDRVEAAAFRNPDGTLVVVLLNRGKEPVPVILRLGNRLAHIELHPEAVTTGVIAQEG